MHSRMRATLGSGQHQTWHIRMCAMTCAYVWRDSFICVPWLMCICEVTRSYVQDAGYFWEWSTSDVTRSYLWRDSFTCVPWLVRMCDVTHSYVWRDSFICARCGLLLGATSHVTHSSNECVEWLCHEWGMNVSRMRNECVVTSGSHVTHMRELPRAMFIHPHTSIPHINSTNSFPHSYNLVTHAFPHSFLTFMSHAWHIHFSVFTQIHSHFLSTYSRMHSRIQYTHAFLIYDTFIPHSWHIHSSFVTHSFLIRDTIIPHIHSTPSFPHSFNLFPHACPHSVHTCISLSWHIHSSFVTQSFHTFFSHIHSHIHSTHSHIHPTHTCIPAFSTGWRKLIACLKSQDFPQKSHYL